MLPSPALLPVPPQLPPALGAAWPCPLQGTGVPQADRMLVLPWDTGLLPKCHNPDGVGALELSPGQFIPVPGRGAGQSFTAGQHQAAWGGQQEKPEPVLLNSSHLSQR